MRSEEVLAKVQAMIEKIHRPSGSAPFEVIMDEDAFIALMKITNVRDYGTDIEPCLPPRNHQAKGPRDRWGKAK